MTFREAVAELRAKHPKADLSPAVVRGECSERAAGTAFTKGRGGVYAGKTANGTEVLIYYNDTEHRICCTEIDFAEE
ncbi:MAG TPA: hypothetical protein VM597_28395 [Gemmataceae bacterium]|jgi:hypothetical protein|nr:hypothetical protein [Gemmataceae bacterium]